MFASFVSREKVTSHMKIIVHRFRGSTTWRFKKSVKIRRPFADGTRVGRRAREDPRVSEHRDRNSGCGGDGGGRGPGEEGNGAEKSRRIAAKAGREGDRERERDEDEEEEKSEQRVLRTRVIETQITLRNSLP